MKYITPSTHDFTKDASQWRLEPEENQTYELQAVTMTFDADINLDSDFIIKFWNYNVSQPIKEIKYSSFIDWIRKSTDHEKIEGVHSKPIHKFYMNFSNDIILNHKDLDSNSAHYMTIDIDNGQVLKDKNGEKCDIAIGEYIINLKYH